MTTTEMLTTLQFTPNTEATAPSVLGQPPLRAWVCYRDGDECQVQIATEELQGETTVFEALAVVPMRDDWEAVM